jgi:fluoroacetyl-CoA thioesterase
VASLDFVVGPADTAAALGSGDLPVLGTPALLAWIEATTVAAAADLVGLGQTTVGSRVELEHLAPCVVGAQVRVHADLAHRDGRLLRFAVAASDGDGRLLASGTLTRVQVDPDRFLARLRPPGPSA